MLQTKTNVLKVEVIITIDSALENIGVSVCFYTVDTDGNCYVIQEPPTLTVKELSLCFILLEINKLCA